MFIYVFCLSRTEDDPLSDVWDSDDSQFDEDGQKSDEEVKPVKHIYEKIKTRTGTMKIDMTPPDVLLVEAHANMHSFYKQKMVRQSAALLSKSNFFDDTKKAHCEVSSTNLFLFILTPFFPLKSYCSCNVWEQIKLKNVSYATQSALYTCVEKLLFQTSVNFN